MRLKIGATQSDTQMDTSDLEKAQRDLRALGNEMPQVAVRALNKTMTGTKTDVKDVIRQKYNIKAGAIGKRIKVAKRATKNDISGFVRSKGYHIGLTSDISPTAKQPQRGTGAGAGVIINVKKETGRQLIPRAFIQPGLNSGKLIVLRRPGDPAGQHENLVPRYGEGKQRLDAFYGPHPETLMNAPENWAKIQSAAAKRIDTNIQREIDAEFRRQEGKW